MIFCIPLESTEGGLRCIRNGFLRILNDLDSAYDHRNIGRSEEEGATRRSDEAEGATEEGARRKKTAQGQ